MKSSIHWFSLLGLDKLKATVRQTVRNVAVGVDDRAALARLEWIDQKERVQRLAVLGVAGAALTVVLLFAFSAAVLVQFWDTPYRQATGWLIAVFWLIVWVSVIVGAMRVATQIGNGFSLTRQELRRDWQAVKDRI